MAKSKDWGIGFSQGYACALASLIRIKGTDTNIDEIIAAQFPTVKSLKDQQVDEYDLEVLLPIVKEHEAKKHVNMPAQNVLPLFRTLITSISYESQSKIA